MGNPYGASVNMFDIPTAQAQVQARGFVAQPFYRKLSGPDPKRDWPGGFAEGFKSDGKRELDAFFQPAAYGGWMAGMPSSTDFEQSRAVRGKFFNNAAPAPENVGPGLGLGPGDAPRGGFHQFEAQEYAKDPTVDDLRPLSRPKLTYEGRVTSAGKAPVTGREALGAVAKNRAEKTAETGLAYALTTAAGTVAQAAIPMTVDKCTARECTGDTGGQAGPAIRAVGPSVVGDAVPARRPVLDPFGERGLANGRGATTAGVRDDFGKASVEVYANERDTTTCQTPVANLWSVVKALTTPLLDAVRLNRKEFLLDAPRLMGQLQAGASMPAKMTVYDPSDTLRTTIKETLVHDTVLGNLVGGPQRVVTYDPDEIVARATVRQTLDRIDPVRNMRAVTLKLTLIDPDDRARTTVKETALVGYRPGGLGQNKGDGYATFDDDAKQTQRSVFTEDPAYAGNPERQQGTGYETFDDDARQTQRATLTADPSHTGGARSATLGQKRDEENVYVNETREGTLAGRAPTQTSVKSAAGKDFVVIQEPLKGAPCAPRATLEPVFSSQVPTCPGDSTRSKLPALQDNTPDASLLDAFRRNPYTQPLDSA